MHRKLRIRRILNTDSLEKTYIEDQSLRKVKAVYALYKKDSFLDVDYVRSLSAEELSSWPDFGIYFATDNSLFIYQKKYFNPAQAYPGGKEFDTLEILKDKEYHE